MAKKRGKKKQAGFAMVDDDIMGMGYEPWGTVSAGVGTHKPTAIARPGVYIHPKALEKLDLYIQGCKEEISGIGTVRQVGRDFVIDEVFLLEQEVTGGTTDIDDDAIAKFLVEWIGRDRDPLELKLWWHSHCNFSTFWSSTDNSTIEKFQNGWMISVVGNHARDWKTRLDVFAPLRITLDALTLRAQTAVDPKVKALVEIEIAAKVTKKTYTTVYAGSGRPYMGPYGGGGSYGAKRFVNGKWEPIETGNSKFANSPPEPEPKPESKPRGAIVGLSLEEINSLTDEEYFALTDPHGFV